MKIGRRVGMVVVLLGCLVIGACNTTKGLGKDLESAGDAIQNAADRNGAD